MPFSVCLLKCLDNPKAPQTPATTPYPPLCCLLWQIAKRWDTFALLWRFCCTAVKHFLWSCLCWLLGCACAFLSVSVCVWKKHVCEITWSSSLDTHTYLLDTKHMMLRSMLPQPHTIYIMMSHFYSATHPAPPLQPLPLPLPLSAHGGISILCVVVLAITIY